MDHLTLYHNPGCKHSRGALELLAASNSSTIEYLKTPPTRELNSST